VSPDLDAVDWTNPIYAQAIEDSFTGFSVGGCGFGTDNVTVSAALSTFFCWYVTSVVCAHSASDLSCVFVHWLSDPGLRLMPEQHAPSLTKSSIYPMFSSRFVFLRVLSHFVF